MTKLILDFAGVSSTGKTTVIQEVFKRLRKTTWMIVNQVPSVSRSVAELGSGTSEETPVFTQAYISLNNWVDILKSAAYNEITLTTDLGIRSTAYLMGIEPLKGSVDERMFNKLVSTQMTFSRLLLSCDFLNIMYFYIPIEFLTVSDGIRSENNAYHKKIDSYLIQIYKELGITPIVLRGSVEERVDIVMRKLDEKGYCI